MGSVVHDLVEMMAVKVNQLKGSMIVCQSKGDKVMVYTIKCIGGRPSQQTQSDLCLLAWSFLKDGQQLEVVLGAARHTFDESLLCGSVEEMIVHHVQ